MSTFTHSLWLRRVIIHSQSHVNAQKISDMNQSCMKIMNLIKALDALSSAQQIILMNEIRKQADNYWFILIIKILSKHELMIFKLKYLTMVLVKLL